MKPYKATARVFIRWGPEGPIDVFAPRYLGRPISRKPAAAAASTSYLSSFPRFRAAQCESRTHGSYWGHLERCALSISSPRRSTRLECTPLRAYHRAREILARWHEVDIPQPMRSARRRRASKAANHRSAGPAIFATTSPQGAIAMKICVRLLRFGSNMTYRPRAVATYLLTRKRKGIPARIACGVPRPYVYEHHSSLPLQITDWKFQSQSARHQFFKWVEEVRVRGDHAP